MRNKIYNLIGFGFARLFYPDRELQEVQVEMQSGETRDEVEHAQPYGFSHLPHEGAEAVSVFPDGDRSFGLVINVYDRRYRLKLENEGEVALYDDLEQKVHLTRDGIIIKSSKKVTVDTPETHFTGTVYIPKDAIIGGKSFNDHYHKYGSLDTTEPKG